MLAVMSSSSWTLTAGLKSCRRLKMRHEPSLSNPTRRALTLMRSPSRRTALPWRPFMMPTVKWLRQSPFHSGR